MARNKKIVMRPAAQELPVVRERGGAESVSFLTHLTRQRLLSAQEEVDLANRVRMGDTAARARFVECNMRLVINIAKGYHHALVPFEDLVQEGAIGLMTAAEKFDPKKGYRFSTYATYWVRQAISRAIDNKARTIRIPAHVSESIRKIDRLRMEAIRDGREEPSLELLAQQLGLTQRRVSILLRAAQDPVSLDMLIGDDESTNLAALLDDKSAVDPQDEIIRREVAQRIQGLLDVLPDRERMVMRRRFGFEENDKDVLQEIGEDLQLSRERVRQIEVEAIKRLRRYFPRLQRILLT